MALKTIEEIRVAIFKSNQNWFGDINRVFFASRIHSQVWSSKEGGAYFISSEQLLSCSPGTSDGSRKFTINYCHLTGHIEVVGEFMKYSSKEEAAKTIRQIIGG
jgi:hypothetical protein